MFKNVHAPYIWSNPFFNFFFFKYALGFNIQWILYKFIMLYELELEQNLDFLNYFSKIL